MYIYNMGNSPWFKGLFKDKFNSMQCVSYFSLKKFDISKENKTFNE